MDFKQLSDVLKRTSDELVRISVKAVNVNLTLRNWLFGYYIVEYEQNGEDRAKYRKSLVQNLAKEINIKGLTAPELSRCRQFYLVYPDILGTLSQKFIGLLSDKILGLQTQEFGADLKNYKPDYYEKLVSNIPYSHFIELIKIDDSTKRRYYELLILKTVPSVRELRRLVDTLSYERLGLSADKESGFEKVIKNIEPRNGRDLVKSHYFFEFLNINNPELAEESELESGLISHLQEFIIELGDGFCFEARQKRILIGDEYFFIDLVFYHRILKCHVLIELKTEWVKHEHIGQLKVYLQHYKRTMIAPDDNPPVGILLVTGKNKTLVEYAIADADKEIFVSKYQLQLPDKKELERFIKEELRKM